MSKEISINKQSSILDDTQTGCLSDSQFNCIKAHFRGDIQLTRAYLNQCANHIEKCHSCAKALEDSQIVSQAGFEFIIEQESLHTSNPPYSPSWVIELKSYIKFV